MKYKIAIVDDHVLIANALKSIISNFPQFEVIHISENGLDLQQKLNKESEIPNIVLLDVSMPIMDGFETAQWLKENYPEVLIMALSMQDDDKSLIKMIKNGAKGYMLKNAQPTQLIEGLNNLMERGQFFPDWASSKIITSISGNSTSIESCVDFSEREKEFLKYVTTEMTYKEISEIMYCSPRTVENYRDSLFEKLELKSRVGLAVYAIKNGFSV
ncbi:DNA-binding NarL/FixJ family response regulator [Mesoflavibacter sabulilitoris]|uniref:DNA-binding response regulator n=1 Tax=Mesoflavibacter zeaxanthinifaciens subsp. sabulilitoris TaxID=1520893 RepID=A0A2T1N652_9FLAO|nr:response regulator transcription factor [Mesoflavibacter zeaxanthinifaciens]MBB3123294.1 DNA-binding NarL/FixJ family response regulator [Mesoflavibacter zeaxanthinifaciens subsp. sabulilitoris]PSG87069.1 DNA-binding response regulator [Mesoflavibacter zeaxanthinifaciens subsp. sabulilitoris]